MNKKITAAALSGVFAVGIAANAFAAKAPGDFLPPGWTVTNTDAAASWTLDLDIKKSGNASLIVKADSGEGGSVKIQQKVTGLEPQTEYTFSFFAKTNNSKYFKMIRDVIYSVDARNEGSETSDWYEKTVTFTTGKNKTSADFQFMIKDGDSTVVRIDDCSLVKKGDSVNLLTNPGFESGIDAQAPDPVTNLSAVEDDKSCVLKWTDSVSQDADKVIIYRDGAEVARLDKGAESYSEDNLENGREYKYKLIVTDGWENESVPAEITAVPTAQREAPEVFADDENNVIGGIDSTMEYRIDEGEWITYDTAPDLSGTHIVEVRYKKTATEKESKTITLIFYKNKPQQEAELSASVNVGLDGITIMGEANAAKVTALAVPNGGDISQLVYAKELIPTAGKLEAHFVMPAFAARGSYVLSLNSDGKKLEIPFSYVSGDDVDTFAKSMKGKSEAEIKQMISDENNKDIISSLGIDTEDYNTYFDYDLAAKTLFENADKLDGNMLSDILGGQMLLSMLNKSNTAVNILTTLDKYSKYADFTFEDKSWRGIEDNSLKSVICSYFAAAKFDSLKEAEKQYVLKNIYYRINNESYVSLGNIMTKYAEELELADKDSYKSYQNADSAKKTDIQKKIKLAKSEYNDNQSLYQALTAALGGSSSSGSGSGNGSSGGSGSGGSSSGGGRAPSGSVASTVSGSFVSDDKKEEIFRDLTDVQWAKEAIEALYKMGVVSGIGKNEFCPMNTVTREQTAKMLVDAFDFTLSEIPQSFNDVEENRWSYPYVMIMRDNKIISGYEDGSFKPDKSITREELAFILTGICEKKGIKLSEKRSADGLSDLSDGAQYAQEALKKLYCAGIMNGTSENEISPKGTATRAMAAQLIYNLIKEGKAK